MTKEMTFQDAVSFVLSWFDKDAQDRVRQGASGVNDSGGWADAAVPVNPTRTKPAETSHF